MITEVFVDGNYERIELTNFSTTDFSGDITIVGFGNNQDIWTTSVSITGHDVLVLKHPHVSYISSDVHQLAVLPTWRLLSDTQRLSLSLFEGTVATTGNLLDVYDISASDIASLTNRSSHRMMAASGLTQQQLHTCRFNTTDVSLSINPGVVVTNSCDQYYPVPITVPDPVCSGNLHITEVHRDDGYVGDYVEIKSDTSLS